jgi:hypothetical protein
MPPLVPIATHVGFWSLRDLDDTQSHLEPSIKRGASIDLLTWTEVGILGGLGVGVVLYLIISDSMKRKRKESEEKERPE